MYNSVTLCGRITREIKLEETDSGKVFVRNSLAVNNIFNKSTDFVNIVAWNNIAENMTKFLKTGSLILVEGRLQVNVVGTEKERRTFYNVVINKMVFLDSKKTTENLETKIKKTSETTIKKEIEKQNSFDNKNDEGIEWE